MKKILLVGGNFGEKEGKSSSLFRKIAKYFLENIQSFCCNYINGGTMDDLVKIPVESYNVILWGANISNDLDKHIIKTIKTRNPKCILISTKRNQSGKYNSLQIINHALNIKSNLIIEFQATENKEDLVKMNLLDPLGNCFYSGYNPFTLSERMGFRVEQLQKYHRIGSVKTSDPLPYIEPEEKYLEIILKHGRKFQEFLTGNSENSTRFLGNTSFRCLQGFPSMRVNDSVIMVSQRNISKEHITKNSFVPVQLGFMNFDSVYYYTGDQKPSVDTPVQLKLYSQFKNINYMLHSHVYIKDAMFWTTRDIIPCGCVEEANSIISEVPKNSNFFTINLRGHGCLIAADDYKKIEEVEFHPRIIPEMVFDDYFYELGEEI